MRVLKLKTYKFIHDDTNLLNRATELIEINSSFIHDIEIFELFAHELLVVHILGVFLIDFIT